MATGFEKFMRAAGTAADRLRRNHPDSVIAKTPIALMLGPSELDALDAWIAQRPEPKPSRQEAVRLLLAEALARA
jgi:hypothetical protein